MTLHGATFNGQLTLSSPINISLGVSNGTLTISGAPANVGRNFTSYKPPEQALEVSNTVGFISWSEIFGLRAEGVTVNFNVATSQATIVIFQTSAFNSPAAEWKCRVSQPIPCPGISINHATGKMTFSNTILSPSTTGSNSSIILSRTLSYTPF